MTDCPTVAVIVPAFNRAALLPRAIASIWATGYPALEVLIVDDGSSDDTRAVAGALAVSAPPGRCRVLRHPDRANHGVSATRNLGIRATRSEWIAFLDADDAYLPNRFECLRNTQPQIDGYFGTTRIVVEGEDDTGRAWLAQGSDLFGIRERVTGQALLDQLLAGRCWAISAITVRRSLLDRTGLFDPEKHIAEDCDLWMRLGCVGRLEPVHLDDPTSLYYRDGANSYHYDVAHRAANLRALLDTQRWARTVGLPATQRGLIAAAARNYARRTLVAAFEVRRPEVGRDVFRIMLAARQYRFFLDPQVWRVQRAMGRIC